METLALALPHAGISKDAAHDMLDLYFALLSRAGLTGKMLISACERYIMAPNGGKGKFFPDPGQLAEMAKDEIRDRKRELEALDKSLLAMAMPAASPVEDNVVSIDAIRSQVVTMQAESAARAEAARRLVPVVQREETAETSQELLDTLAKRKPER